MMSYLKSTVGIFEIYILAKQPIYTNIKTKKLETQRNVELCHSDVQLIQISTFETA